MLTIISIIFLSSKLWYLNSKNQQHPQSRICVVLFNEILNLTVSNNEHKYNKY